MNLTNRSKLLIITFLLIVIGCSKDADLEHNYVEQGGFGWIPSDPDWLASVQVLDTSSFFQKTEAFQPDFDLSMPTPRNQGSNQGSCLAFAVGYAARSYVWSKNNNLNFNYSDNVVFSPEFIYNSLKPSGLPCSVGLHPEHVFDLLIEKGVCSWSCMPYSAQNGCTNLPSQSQLTEAMAFKIDTFFRVEDLSVNNLKAILFDKNPIIAGVQTSQAFKQASGSYVWSSQDTSAITGDHGLVICGWDDTKGENGAWKVMNSWGTGWSDGGFGWIDYGHLQSIVRTTQGGLEEVFVLANDGCDGSLTGTYSGTYSWNCQSTNPGNWGIGSSEIEIALNDNGDGSLNGTISYLGGTSTFIGQRYSSADYTILGYLYNGVEDPLGCLVQLTVEESSSFVHNWFTGTISGNVISGTTVNGDGPNYPGSASEGCSAPFDPAGNFFVVR